MSAISNARWISVSQGARILTQLISITVLARLLPTEAYGLMAMATVVTNLAYLFRDLGTAAAIIQVEKINLSLTSTIHWSNVGIGLGIAGLIVWASPAVAHYFQQEELRQILHLLALVFPLASLTVVRQALLERASNFALVAKIEVGAAMGGLVVAIAVALSGGGVYSLVLQLLASTFISTLLIFLQSKFRPLWHWSLAEFKSITGFSGNLSLFNLVLYLSRNADSMVIGRLLGTAALGVYSVAYRIMLFPLQNMTFVATRALYPVLSRKQSSNQEMAHLYLKAIGFIAFLTAPLMAGLFVLREPFIHCVFGDKWNDAIAVIAWLAPVGYLQSIVSTTGTVFMAKGKTDVLLYLGLYGTVLQVVAFLIGARWGIEGVAACYLAANVLNAMPPLYYSARLLGLKLGELLICVLRPVVLALVMAGLLQVMTKNSAHFLYQPWQVLSIQIPVGALFYLITAYFMLRPQMNSFRSFLKLG